MPNTKADSLDKSDGHTSRAPNSNGHAWAGSWADGLITVWQPPDTLRRLVDAFREGGGEGKPLALQVHVSWAPDEDSALKIAFDQWRTNVFEPPLCWGIATVEEFDQAARHVIDDHLVSSGARTTATGQGE